MIIISILNIVKCLLCLVMLDIYDDVFPSSYYHHSHHHFFVTSYFVPCHPGIIMSSSSTSMRRQNRRTTYRRDLFGNDTMMINGVTDYGYCPLGNTCCYKHTTTNTTNTIASCIPNDLGSDHATCCYDDENNNNNNYITTGCGVGYTCERMNNVPYCLATNNNDNGKSIDPLVQILPRYQLCHTNMLLMIQKQQLGFMKKNKHTNVNEPFPLYGFPMIGNAVIPYYSTHGSIHNSKDTNNTTESLLNDVKIVIIVLHGAGRNADDYFCSMVSAIYHESTHNTKNISMKNILIIAPRFTLSTDDDINVTLTSLDGDILQWDGNIINDTSGPWRYGANAIIPKYASNISSYDVMDMIIQTILSISTSSTSSTSISLLPNLQQIVTIGHSSGGQFMQRWSLLTPIWEIYKMKSIVINPSSYVYLTNKRYMIDPIDPNHHVWTIPNNISSPYCSQYNQWQYGLEPNHLYNKTYYVDYVNRILINQYHYNYTMLLERYRLRNIIYLIGEMDQCPISGADTNGYCNSHGLEITCSDMIQGIHRYERHWNYYLSLQNIVYRNKKMNHYRYTIPHIGHDHSLIFHSNIGLQTILNPISIIT